MHADSGGARRWHQRVVLGAVVSVRTPHPSPSSHKCHSSHTACHPTNPQVNALPGQRRLVGVRRPDLERRHAEATASLLGPVHHETGVLQYVQQMVDGRPGQPQVLGDASRWQRSRVAAQVEHLQRLVSSLHLCAHR